MFFLLYSLYLHTYFFLGIIQSEEKHFGKKHKCIFLVCITSTTLETMPYIIIIDKLGTVKETNIKEYKEEDLYKKANFKSAEGFALQTTWTGLSLSIRSLSSSSSSEDKKTVSVSVYGKTTGRAGQENKYEFPPPIDSVLFFGGCVLVAKSESDDSMVDLRISSWNIIYETLMGGFEDLDLGDRDAEDENEEEDDVDPNLIGKNGYLRDGFVVEDEDEDEEEDEFEDLEEEELVPDTESEEEEVKPKKKSKRKPAAASTKEEKKKPDKDKKKTDKDKKKNHRIWELRQLHP